MPQCAVSTCRNSHRRTRGRRIRYHRFPQIPEVRSLWVTACGRSTLANGEISFNIQTARICSLHFTIDSYEKDVEHLVLGLPARSRLRRGAVPTIAVPVTVQPITRMLVEDAKRSLLKAAHAKMLNGQRAATNGQKVTTNGHKATNGQKVTNCVTYKKTAKPKVKRQQRQTCQRNRLPIPREEDIKSIEDFDILLALGLKPRLNKMHAMDESGTNGKKVEAGEKKEEEDDSSRKSPQVPQSQQNGAALPEETAAAAADRLHSSVVKEEPYSETASDATKHSTTDPALPKQTLEVSRSFRSDDRANRKRRSTEQVASTNGKRTCAEQRDQLVTSLITGYETASADELASRSDVLRAELQALDELARAAEIEWNRVLTMRKLKEEAFLRIERRRQVINFMEGPDRVNDVPLPSNSEHDPEEKRLIASTKDKLPPKEEHGDCNSLLQEALYKNEKAAKPVQQPAINLSTRNSVEKKHPDILVENRQIGEGRQGPIVDVRSIIADYRLRHPEFVPRRGRRMRNSVNVNLGAGGAMVETSQNADSRPSSTDSCKSNSNTDANMSFKDVLVQFAKLSQQQGEALKTPQNYPDVTLHPVAPSPTMQTSAPQPSGSLLHGILTKAQSPRPTTFSPTLARLLTAPERERSAPNTTVTPHSNSRSQRLHHTYQESNPVSISDLLSSSKGRTEITITPVVNPPMQSHLNNMLHVDDDEETVMMEERESRISGGNREDREISPRCQGCHERAAQYVCAGCGNQWYCSPECQAAAWDEHSDVCSG